MANNSKIREWRRKTRHKRIRRDVLGDSDRPRLCVHRSLKNFHAQIIDDVAGKVLFGMSTLDKALRSKFKFAGNIEGASILGAEIAKKAKKKGIGKVKFDRGGYRYHGRVKAFADSVRDNGLEF